VAISKTKLGIPCSEIGTHSIPSIAAMAMYLARVPIFSIMLIGHWSSMVFLKCIGKQVQKFFHGKMMEIQSFKHIQNPTSMNLMESIVDDSFALTIG
jgi:hypothetical protein